MTGQAQLPLTVIGGYLGAGKTSLINELLSGDHGRRLMVMVNDFGAVNIDAALLSSVSGDTMELTNGCVCCTMGADLFMAVGDVLDRADRPDHLIIEASGIADPAKIAGVARTEPELTYAGIVTVVDGLHFTDLLEDAQIAPQLESQVAVADLVYLSKAMGAEVQDRLTALGAPTVLTNRADVAPLIWSLSGDAPETDGRHAHFTKWVHQGTAGFTRAELEQKLAARPAGLYRLKGFVRGGWEVQIVGKTVDIRARDGVEATTLVGIGPEGHVTTPDIDAWWAAPLMAVPDAC
ncbi:GTP-binding protein [Aliishimia ponticola]|uniref:GTP-binding protein n=1 Tax=Aliishimia ponticola TaxID=2499833 RepID=A0A4S4NLL9_9RHOB|nr:GTP-binding protein [Aliishimia ponticola]THH37070.1 GTP-binding protein [Aliishimia ponticola]